MILHKKKRSDDLFLNQRNFSFIQLSQRHEYFFEKKNFFEYKIIEIQS